LTTSQIEILQRLWCAAGLSPTCGYETVTLAIAVASDQTLVTILTSVNFDDPCSVATSLESLFAVVYRPAQDLVGRAIGPWSRVGR
jgi:hypothetical protein